MSVLEPHVYDPTRSTLTHLITQVDILKDSPIVLDACITRTLNYEMRCSTPGRVVRSKMNAGKLHRE